MWNNNEHHRLARRWIDRSYITVLCKRVPWVWGYRIILKKKKKEREQSDISGWHHPHKILYQCPSSVFLVFCSFSLFMVQITCAHETSDPQQVVEPLYISLTAGSFVSGPGDFSVACFHSLSLSQLMLWVTLPDNTDWIAFCLTVTCTQLLSVWKLHVLLSNDYMCLAAFCLTVTGTDLHSAKN